MWAKTLRQLFCCFIKSTTSLHSLSITNEIIALHLILAMSFNYIFKINQTKEKKSHQVEYIKTDDANVHGQPNLIQRSKYQRRESRKNIISAEV